jgi:4-hydroxybenzoate polyprenyltransferase
METNNINNASFIKRFFIYQNERFPFLAHGLLISAFSFSAISYSRLCRGFVTFIDIPQYLNCILITVTLFFLVRVFDEFKDKEEDALYRKNLPVPRGLIRLKELLIVGIITFIIQLVAILLHNKILYSTYLPVIIYLCLMGKEFFIASWLKNNQFWYVVSHMFIIPLVDIYASSYDWLLQGVAAPKGLLFFFGVSYMNGIVLEIGRKIKTPATEEQGVKSYTFLLGTRNAIFYWLTILLITLLLAYAAAYYAHHSWVEYTILTSLFILCSVPAYFFLKDSNNTKYAKAMEYSSVLWTFGMYLCLGGIPMLVQLFK